MKQHATDVTALVWVYVFKIAATLLAWCVPLLFFPAQLLETAGFPVQQPTYMFVRMLGWAYLALCVGYWFGLRAALHGEIVAAPLWVGMVSNGGACLYLLFYALTGTWCGWGWFVQFVGWGSIVATALITLGLYWFGIRHIKPLA